MIPVAASFGLMRHPFLLLRSRSAVGSGTPRQILPSLFSGLCFRSLPSPARGAAALTSCPRLPPTAISRRTQFASAASRHPEFARELPRFVSEVRRLFTPEEIRTHLARLEREESERAADASEEDQLYPESPIEA